MNRFLPGFLVVAAALAVVATLPAASAQDGGCDITPQGIFCPDEQGGDDNFWDILGVVLSVLAMLGSITVFIIAGILLRRRRYAVGTYLQRLDQTYAQYKDDPPQGVVHLSMLRHEVRRRYTAGRLEDAPYLELEKRVMQYIARMRMVELEQTVPDLPKRIEAEVDRLIGDGNVSQRDIERILDAATGSRVARAKREALADLMERWAHQDLTGGGPVPDPHPAGAETRPTY